MLDAEAANLKLGLVGAGAMGSGIAQVAAVGGVDVLMIDADADRTSRAREEIGKHLNRQAEKGRVSSEAAQAALARISIGEKIGDLADCDVVIEAVVEDLSVKQKIFAELEDVVSPQCVLASNTSSLSIGAIASACRVRDRIAGMHFFNPVPLMKLVEVVRGPDTDPVVLDALATLGRRMGRTPVVVRDTPGFLVNLGGRAFVTEALHIVHEGAATPAQVDAVMRDCGGFRMGPFELMDLTGLDVNYPVTRIIWEGFFHDPRLRTTPMHRALLEAGRLGRKSGVGFHSYQDGAAANGSADAPAGDAPARQVVYSGKDTVLRDLLIEAGASILEADDGRSPVVIAPRGEDCTAVVARENLDASRVVAVDTLCDTSTRVLVMTSPGGTPDVCQSVVDLLARVRKVTAIGDSPGFIAQRILAMVGNLGCEMAQIGLAQPQDIDTAMRLGLNYPKGPLELCDALGLERVLTVLRNMQEITGDDRYRPSQWLRRRALLGLSALQL